MKLDYFKLNIGELSDTELLSTWRAIRVDAQTINKANFKLKIDGVDYTDDGLEDSIRDYLRVKISYCDAYFMKEVYMRGLA